MKASVCVLLMESRTTSRRGNRGGRAGQVGARFCRPELRRISATGGRIGDAVDGAFSAIDIDIDCVAMMRAGASRLELWS